MKFDIYANYWKKNKLDNKNQVFSTDFGYENGLAIE